VNHNEKRVRLKDVEFGHAPGARSAPFPPAPRAGGGHFPLAQTGAGIISREIEVWDKNYGLSEQRFFLEKVPRNTRGLLVAMGLPINGGVYYETCQVRENNQMMGRESGERVRSASWMKSFENCADFKEGPSLHHLFGG